MITKEQFDALRDDISRWARINPVTTDKTYYRFHTWDGEFVNSLNPDGSVDYISIESSRGVANGKTDSFDWLCSFIEYVMGYSLKVGYEKVEAEFSKCYGV